MSKQWYHAKPILATDVLVIGGGLAGVAAARASAAAGRDTWLLERRTYLGADLTATLRPWLSEQQYNALSALLDWSPGAAALVTEGTLALIPDACKLALEDTLLASGARLLYATRPIGWHHDGQFFVRVTGKSGTGVITARRVIDASSDAPLARLQAAARDRRRVGTLPLRRTIEFTGADLTGLPDALTLPAEVSDWCRVHRGHASDQGHVLVEHGWQAFSSQSATWREELEVDARYRSIAVARWLKSRHPAFAAARLTATAHEVSLPPAWRIPVQPPLWVAGPNADLSDAAAAALAMDPVNLVRHGLEAGIAAAAWEPDQPASAPAPPLARPPADLQADVLVIGGGTSGVSAALGAAAHHCRVVLAEMNPGLGGTGTVGGVDSYWFGRRGGFNRRISEWVAEQHEWMGWTGAKWNIEAKMFALLKAAREAGVTVLLGTVLAEVRCDQTGRVTGALLATPDGLIEVAAAVTVDATGDGDVAVRAGAEFVYGADRDAMTMWYSMCPQLRPGIIKNNFTSTVDVGDPFDYTRAILAARRRLNGHDHGAYVAPRESRHIIGAVRITLTDLLQMRRWPDVVNVHFSNHDIKGQNTSDWLRIGLLPPNLEAEIPYRALIPNGIGGLIVTGKAFSATHDALPPIRMQADLENLGFVAGTAAALAAREGLEPRQLPVTQLQQHLVAAEILPAAVLNRNILELPPSEAELRQWVLALRDDEPLFLYGEMEMHETRLTPIPMVQVCTAGPAILPLLREAMADPERRVMAARALAWHGDQAATPVLLEELRRHLEGGEVPRRTAQIRYVTQSPDHGAMPEACYLLHTLALVRDERAVPLLLEVAEKLNPTPERLRDNMSGLFHYVDALCDIAERLGDPACLPALHRLHAEPLWHGKVSHDLYQADFFEERLAYLELLIARAMARCGDRTGVDLLTGYLTDARRILARHAHRELKAITGQELPPNPAAWRDWAATVTAWPRRPWTGPRG